MLEEIFKLIIKGSAAVIYLFLVIKVIGKKQISELNIFDYIIGISLGNIAAEMTVNDNVTIIYGMIAMSVYGLISLIASIITNKSIVARRFITGDPVTIMEKGKISRDQLKKCRIDVNDLLQDARESGYFDISEIDSAIMEPSGKISFLPKAKYKSLTPTDMKLKVNETALTATLIIDGKIMYDNLNAIGHDEAWLLKRLENNKYHSPKDLLLVICDNKEHLSFYPIDSHTSRSLVE